MYKIPAFYLVFLLFSSNLYGQGDAPFLFVLGIAQDAGYPQAGCRKDCCRKAWEGELTAAKVSCLGLVDPAALDALEAARPRAETPCGWALFLFAACLGVGSMRPPRDPSRGGLAAGSAR